MSLVSLEKKLKKMPIQPENINNDDSDFLFQQKLYVGLDDNQFEVRDRFNKVENTIESLKETISTNESGDITIIVEQPPDAGGNPQPPQEVNITEHLNNTVIHLPEGGTPDQVLTAQLNGLRTWKGINSILPEVLRGIVESGTVVTPDQVVAAFRQITVSAWSMAGQPLGNNKIKAIAHDGARYYVGANNGRVVSGNPNAWNAQQPLFDDPVEAITACITPNAKKIAVILNAYSDFYIAVDGMFSRRLSVRVTEIQIPDPDDPEKTITGYTDKYETADFVAAISGNGKIVLFTTKGTVYSADYDQVIAEYNRSFEKDYDRHSTIWLMNESQESITSNALCAAFGGGKYIVCGVLGKIATSDDTRNWSTVTSNLSSNINVVAAGNDRFLTVGDNGQIAYALYNDLSTWHVVTSLPFGTNRLTTVTFGEGAGLFIIGDDHGNVKYTRNCVEFFDCPADLVGYATASGFGDTYFLVGDNLGYLRQSLSIANLLSVVSQGQFVDLSNSVWTQYYDFIARWNAYITGEDYTGSPFVMLDQLGRPSIADGGLQSHATGLPTLNEEGIIPDHYIRRGEADGVAPLNEKSKVPADFLDIYDFEVLLMTLRNEMCKTWNLLPNTLFSDLVGFSRINDIAYSDNKLVVVGERGRIASGSRVRALQMIDSPFGLNESVVGVAIGNDDQDNEIIVAISKNYYSFSRNGGLTWSEERYLGNDMTAIDFCGGIFLIADASGNIYRSVWQGGGEFEWATQESDILTTQGLRAFAFWEGLYYGVGINNKIVSSPDAIYWNNESSPTYASSTNFNSVTTTTDRIIVVGNYGTIIFKQSENPTTWKKAVSGTEAELKSIIYDFDFIVACGSNGTVVVSNEGDVFEPRNVGTNSTLRAIAFQKQFIVASELGQFYGSLSLADVFGLFGDLSPSNEPPRPLQELPDAGESEQYARGDHAHPDTGVVLERMVGQPTTYLTEITLVPNPDNPDEFIEQQTEVVDRYGVPPLGKDGIIPQEFLPPLDISNLSDLLKYGLDFREINPSPFEPVQGESSIIYGAAVMNNVTVIVGEKGIATNQSETFKLLENQPLEDSIIDIVKAFKPDGKPFLIAITSGATYLTSENITDWNVVEYEGNYDFCNLNYHNGIVTITSTNGQILRSQYDATSGELSFAEQETGADY
jgi:photosystem II stability/assembly factor-like uncharacterized protein